MLLLNRFGALALALLPLVSYGADYEVRGLKDPVRECSPTNPCNQCEGDCDTDADCVGDLICFQKDAGQDNVADFIPSCEGIDTSATDWCVVDIRSGNPTMEKQLMEDVVECTPDNPCQECQGDCDSNSDCAGDLVCFTREDTDQIPGCSGTDSSATDWCVDPGEVSTQDPLPLAQGGNDGGDLVIFAYFYTWYIRGDWSRHGLQGNVPSLGYYGSDEPSIAETQVNWAKRAGIDAWVVSWWGRDRMSDDYFFAGMMRASNFQEIQFSMLYELGALVSVDFNDPRTLRGMIDDLIYFRDNFFHLPNYYRVGGRPLVNLYLTRNYVNFRPEMVQQIMDGVGVDMFFVADTPYFGENIRPRGSVNGEIGSTGRFVFEAYTSYNMFTNPRVREGETATDYMFREAVPIYNNWANQITYFPQVLPMYHDFRGHKPLVGNAGQMRQQLEAFACLPKPEGDKYPNIMYMTSWNEWWEGTQLEPDRDGRYGFTFIDELRRFKEAGPANC